MSGRGRSCRLAALPLLLALLSGPQPARAASEAQDLAGRLGWFSGKSQFLLEANRRDPAEGTVAALTSAADALLPARVLDPALLGEDQAAQRLAAAQALGGSSAARRELQAAATRTSLAPRLRAAAAMALAVLHSDLAPAALAIALVDQEDLPVRQLLIHELFSALPRVEGRPGLRAEDRQLLYSCRRIGVLSACGEVSVGKEAHELEQELRRLEASGEQARAAQLVETAPLSAACLSPYLAALAALPGPDSGERVWRAVLQRAEARVVAAKLHREPNPGEEAKAALERMLGTALPGLTDARALAAAANLALLLELRGLVPALESLAARAKSEPLAQLARTAIARLEGEPLPLESLP